MNPTQLEPGPAPGSHKAPHGAELGLPSEKEAPVSPPGPASWLLVGGFGLILAVLAVVTILSRVRADAELEKDTRESSIPVVSVVHPKRSATQFEIELPGNITAFEEAPIYARVSGYLKHWFTDIGTTVTGGQALAEIETPELDQELAQANASLAQANANLEIARISAERWQSLRKSDSVSQQDTDTRVATYKARQADVDAAQANVQRLTELTNFKKLAAPFPGIITVRTMDAGTLVTAGSSREIFRLARIDPLRVYVSLPQTYSQMVKSNDLATLTLAELPGQTYTGRVDRTAGAIDPASRTLRIQILVSNRDGRLLPGSHAMVKLSIANDEDPVVVPINTLLFRDEQGMQVGIVDPAGNVRLAGVTVGRDYGTTVEIVHGLAESDSIILNPSDSLQSGAKVRLAGAGTNAVQTAHE